MPCLWLFLLSITLLFLYTSFLPLYSPKFPKGLKPVLPKPHHHHTSPRCNFWVQRETGELGSLDENFLVSFLCILRAADGGARKWKRKGAWRGGYFPKFNVKVAYHRAVLLLLARYELEPSKHLDIIDQVGLKGTYRVDVDIPADDWINDSKFYDVLIFNTGHWKRHNNDFMVRAMGRPQL